MFLQRSISHTKKFFQITIKSFKSLFSTTSSYQRLPKTPPFKPLSCFCRGGLDRNYSQNSYRELDKYYSDYANRRQGQIVDESEAAVVKKSSMQVEVHNKVEEINDEEKEGELIVYEGKQEKKMIEISNSSNNKWLERRVLVEKKLKELEMMDLSNVENVLDIEEILYYYSRLTCPVYIDIFDKFFIGMYSDLFNLRGDVVAHGKKTTTAAPPATAVASRPRLLYR